MKHWHNRVECAGRHPHEVRELEAERELRARGEATVHGCATSRDVDRPGQRLATGRRTAQLVADAPLETAGCVGIERPRHRCEQSPLHRGGAEPPLDLSLAGAVEDSRQQLQPTLAGTGESPLAYLIGAHAPIMDGVARAGTTAPLPFR